MKKLSIEEINQRLLHRGVRMTGDFVNTRTKTEFTCNFSHTWIAKPNSVLNGRGCPHCSNHSPLTPSLINDRLSNRDITMIGDYTDTITKTEFKCKNNHIWLGRPGNVLSGHGCPICESTERRLTKNAINTQLKDRGITMIGEYTNSRTKTEFECVCGYKWLGRPSGVLARTGCPSCNKGGGYKSSKPGYIYILDFGDYFKYGITNKISDRLQYHSKSGNYQVVTTKLYENGVIAMDWENKIKRVFGGCFVTKEIMPNGWTETLCITKLDQVLKTII